MRTASPVVIPRASHHISRRYISKNALKVLYRLKDAGHLAYLVGGGVRDLLLGREPKDFDVATDAHPGEIKRLFKNCRLIGRRFRLAHVYFHDEIIEVATFRSLASDDQEQEDVPGPVEAASETAAPPDSDRKRPRQPRLLKTEEGMILRDNVFGTPEEDALRRDFTVNALFYNIADFSVIDYVSGMDDLKAGLIRTIGEPVRRFIEDPVRMVRAVRFAAMLGFDIEERTLQALLEQRERVALASPARLYEEVLKLFLLGEAEKVYHLLRKTGLFGVLFPRLGEWLDTESEGYPNVWIGKALEWIDGCVQAGRRIQPHLLLAFIFGRFVESRTSELVAAGMHPYAAIDLVLSDFLREQSARVLIPKKTALLVRDILRDQARFAKTSGKAPLVFSSRPGFSDAYAYFRFVTEITGGDQALSAWWAEFLRHRHDAVSGETIGRRPEALRQRQKSKRRRKRRRAPGVQTDPVQ